MASSSTSWASASASTSTADSNHCYLYDVFLNHRGPDVKKTFVSHLYNRLTDHRLRVFLDRDEIEKGEKITDEIDGAIRASSIHLAIFSPNYCQSPWCLNELLLMLEMKQKSKSMIIPVFFGVKPSELRWTEGQNGVYAQALRSLQNKTAVDSQPRYVPKIIAKWKDALHDVAEISGFELDEVPYNGDEGMLLAAVVERVLEIVPKPPLYVSKYPTGLDDKIKDFEERLLLQEHQTGEARVVGIVGLGGVGKTTLAKEFFNRERTKYRRSSFLSDVREISRSGSLESLQIQLIKDLSQVDVKINNTHEGISLLRKHLSHCHALIIVDDADRIDQLDALLPIWQARDVLNFSGLILVTSRDKSVLTDWGVEDGIIYRLQVLNPQQSTELFCWHAFRQPHAFAGFEQLVNDFLDACKGLPLSLKVIGSLLYRKNLEYWKAQLRKISKILPEDIQKTLKISYDSLDEEEKQIFLDIACLFIGRRKETAIRVWDGSGWEGSLAFQNLQNKCLVEEEAEHIRMHDHLRDLGRDLARTEPLRRIRFAARSLRNQLSSVGEIKTFPECDHLVPELRLQLPDFEDSPVEGIFSVGRSLQLIYFSCDYYPYSSLASKISTRNLFALDIICSNLKTLWRLESQVPLNLRQLQVESCRLSKIPKSIGKLKHLEKIVLRDCGAGNTQMPLESLPEEFCHIASLKHLELRFCHLRSLPDSFGNVTNLKYLRLPWCGLLEMLPDSFGNLTNLQDLWLIGCHKLQKLPNSFGNLTKLQHINLSCCWKLQMLPSSFGNLIRLQHIDLSNCRKLQMLPSSFGNLIRLQHINLSSCGKLQMLPRSFGNLINLQHINLSRCGRLQMLPRSFGNLINLQHIYLSGCEKLQKLPSSFGNLINLQHIYLSGCEKLQRLPSSFGNIINLQHIYLSGCQKLQRLPSSFGNLINLQHIDLSGCQKLQRLPSSFGNLINLQHIYLSGCKKLQRLPSSFGNLINLQHIYLSGCKKLQLLPSSFGNLTKLQHIDLSKCPEMWMPPNSFENFIQLKYLNLTGCNQLIISIETLGKVTTLEDLSLSTGFSLSARENIEAVQAPQLAFLRFLKRLCLDFDFKELPSAIGNLSNLKTLELKSSCLESLPPSLGDLRSLKELTLAYCSFKCLRDSIRMLTQLETLRITKIKDLKVVEIKEFPSIEEATGGEVETATDSGKLEAVLPNLQDLDISFCDRLVKVGALPATLQGFGIICCRELEELPSMETLPSLKSWGLGGCPKLKQCTGWGIEPRKRCTGWRIRQRFKVWAFLRRINRQSSKSRAAST